MMTSFVNEPIDPKIDTPIASPPYEPLSLLTTLTTFTGPMELIFVSIQIMHWDTSLDFITLVFPIGYGQIPF